MARSIETAIVIVSHNSAADLPACLDSLRDADSPTLQTHILVIDNASTDGSAHIVATRYPDVTLLRSSVNDGYTGGHNRGWQYVREHWPNVEFVALLNPDTRVAKDWLNKLTAYMQADERIAVTQPKLRLMENGQLSERLNTAGNRSHYLGFGFTTGYGERDMGQYDEAGPIDFASGAAMVVRAAALRQLGLFDEAMFMYLEDADLSWKCRLAGWKVMYVPRSVVYHRHDPAETLARHLFHLEKNRLWLVLSYYRLRTLALLGPALLAAEIAAIVLAARYGALRQKLRAYGWLMRSETRAKLREKRAAIKRIRQMSDRQWMGEFTSEIMLGSRPRGLLRWVVNPLLGAYGWMARRIMRW